MTSHAEKARRFHALHHAGRILVLPNAWDAASARVLELAGAAAIATTSAGVAASLGYPDGERVPRALAMDAVRRIVAAVDVPVSVDVEAGYDDVRETVRAVVEAGGVGVNLEDALADPGVLVDRIRAAHETAAGLDVPLFVNARTDVYLRSTADSVAKLGDAVSRLRAYEAAGADGLFAPGVDDPATIRELVTAVGRPLNILAGAGVPPVRELERLGVARVSVGSGPMRATLGLVRRIAERLLGDGTYEAFLADAPSHGEVNAMLTR